MSSLHGRLALALTLGLVLLGALQWLVGSLATERLLREQLSQRLERDAQNLLAALEPDAEGRLALDPTRVGAEYVRPLSGHYYRLGIGAGEAAYALHSRSLWDAPLELPEPQVGQTLQRAAVGPLGQPLWVLSAGYEKRATPVVVSVAEDLAPLQAGLARLRLLHGALTVAVVVLVLGVTGWVLRRSLRPVEALRAQLGELQRGERSLIELETPAELTPLVEQLNGLLAMLLRRSERSRQALGNLAHALKTRLATLLQLAETPGFAAEPALRDRLLADVEGLRASIERELRRGRLMGGAHPARRSAPAACAQELSRTLATLHAGKTPDIEIDIDPGLRLAMDPEDLMELLGNLMDNACLWCARRVRVRARTTEGLGLVVEDDGPGCSGADIERLAERGFRADESRPGHGLGLAIVRDLVESYGGALGLDRSPDLGGLRVEARLPANPG